RSSSPQARPRRSVFHCHMLKPVVNDAESPQPPPSTSHAYSVTSAPTTGRSFPSTTVTTRHDCPAFAPPPAVGSPRSSSPDDTSRRFIAATRRIGPTTRDPLTFTYGTVAWDLARSPLGHSPTVPGTDRLLCRATRGGDRAHRQNHSESLATPAGHYPI